MEKWQWHHCNMLPSPYCHCYVAIVPGNISMATWQCQHGNGKMIMATLRWIHGNKNMGLATLQYCSIAMLPWQRCHCSEAFATLHFRGCHCHGAISMLPLCLVFMLMLPCFHVSMSPCFHVAILLCCHVDMFMLPLQCSHCICHVSIAMFPLPYLDSHLVIFWSLS